MEVLIYNTHAKRQALHQLGRFAKKKKMFSIMCFNSLNMFC